MRGNGRLVSQVKRDTGCDYAVNAGFYGGDGKPTHHLKADGKVLARASWRCWGFAWDSGADIRMEALPAENKQNYIAGVELLSPMVSDTGEISYDRKGELGGIRGRTAIAHTGDELILYCSGAGTGDAATLEGVQEKLRRLGAETAIYVDGGGSSQCDFGGGETICASRKVYSYLCVWVRHGASGTPPPTNEKEDKPVSKKVCLDPGHGPGCVNGAPDGSYKEQEFAWDMSQRVKAHLERCDVTVVMTRDAAGYPDLTPRAQVSNKAGADLFVSLHSNAAGNSGWYESPRGLLVYTSTVGDGAGRNVAAKAILGRMREAGVPISGSGLLHEGYTVLVKTAAPAVLIEYGFHTSRTDVERLKSDAHRAKLAEATAKGICDYLGIVWKGEEAPAGPWYGEAQAWAVEQGISDGTRPEDGITRAEVWEMMRRSAEHPAL